MPVLEYLLLALLGSSPAVTPAASALSAESITQPNGGVPAALPQKKPVKTAEKGPEKVKTTSKRTHKHSRQPQFTRHKKGNAS